AWLRGRPIHDAVPGLRLDGLRMCGTFDEAETIDSRLVLATVKAAAKSGALVLNHAKVVGLELRHNRGGAVTLDAGRDGALELRARHVINAAGPWVDHVRALDDPYAEPLVRLSKGVHLLLPLEEGWRAGVAMPLGGGRVALGIPWQGMLMLGTTDTPYSGDPAGVQVTEADVSSVLDEASGFLEAGMLRRDRVRFQPAGLRALAGAMADGLERIHPSGPDVWAQVAYAFRSEWARTVDDVARRRTTLAGRGLLTEEIVARIGAMARSESLVSAVTGRCTPGSSRGRRHAGDAR